MIKNYAVHVGATVHMLTTSHPSSGLKAGGTRRSAQPPTCRTHGDTGRVHICGIVKIELC